MTTIDPAIVIAGLEERIKSLLVSLRTANGGRAEAAANDAASCAYNAQLRTERDALAAALATRTAERDEAVASLASAAAGHRRDCNGSCDIELTRRQVGPAGDVSTCARECAEMWEREAARLGKELARVEGARVTAVGLASDYKTRAEQLAAQVNAITSERDSALANLRACEARVAAVEAESNKAAAEAAALRLRVADLEARPVLTHALLSDAIEKGRKVPPYIARQAADEYMPHLSAVTLPAQDRAEEFLSHFFDALFPGFKERDTDKMLGKDRATQVAAVKHALATLGAAPTTPQAEVFAGVSVEELGTEYWNGVGVRSTTLGRERDTMAGIRAVLARLKVTLVAPVDPVAFARSEYNSRRTDRAWDTLLTDEGRKIMASASRAALIAVGVPVTPERGQ